MTARRRWLIWLSLLGLAGWLVLFDDRSTDAGAADAISLPKRVQLPASQVALPLGPRQPGATVSTEMEPLVVLVERSHWRDSAPGARSPASDRDLFIARNWNPPAPAPAPVSEAEPVAPPLPFTFLGKKLEGGAWEVYLGRGEQTFIVREGQAIDASYRAGKIAPPALDILYLPLGQTQILKIGELR